MHQGERMSLAFANEFLLSSAQIFKIIFELELLLALNNVYLSKFQKMFVAG